MNQSSPTNLSVKILSGVSGSGKSTHARDLIKGTDDMVEVVSADNYFMEDGQYKFDPTKLSEAHAYCFIRFLEALQMRFALIIVDNTNTTAVEIAPYVLGAMAYHYDVEIITFTCQTHDDVKVCAGRNSHGLPFDAVMNQHRRMCDRVLLPWWKNTNQRICG